MRILRPAEVQNMARGEPVTPCNRSSSSSSASSTSNNYADKRNAVQNGIGVSGDNNSTSYSSFAVTADPTVAQAAISGAVASAAQAIAGNSAVAANANSSMADVSKSVVAASSHLADVGLSMLQTNTALANSLEGGVNQTTQAVTSLASQLASTQIASQNDNRYLIAAGLAVVAIVGVAAFSKKAA